MGLAERSDEIGAYIVRDWQSFSRNLLDCNQHLTGDEIRSFSFLSGRHIVLAVISLPAHQEELETSLLVVDFEAEHRKKMPYNESAHSYSLILPRLSLSTLPVSFSIRCDPTPIWAPNPDLQVPFHIAPSNRVHVVSLFFQTNGEAEDEDEEGNVQVAVLFVPQTTLMAYADAQEDKKRAIDWELWGPRGELYICDPATSRINDILHQGTRFIIFPRSQMHSTAWECYSYGSKFVPVPQVF